MQGLGRACPTATQFVHSLASTIGRTSAEGAQRSPVLLSAAVAACLDMHLSARPPGIGVRMLQGTGWLPGAAPTGAWPNSSSETARAWRSHFGSMRLLRGRFGITHTLDEVLEADSVVKHVLCDEGGINNAYVGRECAPPAPEHRNCSHLSYKRSLVR